MTWQDIEKKCISNDSKSEKDSMFIPDTERVQGIWNHANNSWKDCINDYDRFLKVLCEIDDNRFDKETQIYAAAWSGGKAYEDVQGYLAFQHDPIPGTNRSPGWYVGCNAPKNSAWCETRIAVTRETGADGRPFQKLAYAIRLTDVGGDLDKDTWNHFWRLYNLLNLSKEDMYVSTNGATKDINAILESFDPSVHDLIRLLVDKDIPFNEDGGYSLIGDDGYTIIREAEAAVDSLMIVIDPLDDLSAQAFSMRGYTVILPGELDKLKKIIGE